MFPLVLFQSLLALFTLTSGEIYGPAELLQQFAVSYVYADRVYLLSKHEQEFNKMAASSLCRQNGGYLAKLDGGMDKFHFIRYYILVSMHKKVLFYIDRADIDDIPSAYIDREVNRRKDGNCVAFSPVLEPYLGNTSFAIHYNLKDNYPCNEKGKYICEVPLTIPSEPISPVGSKDFLQHYLVTGVYYNRVYLLSRHFTAFNITAANAFCRRCGGYLVELDEGEFWFISLAISQSGLGTPFFTGGNDIDQESHFVWYNSQQQVSDLVPWGRHQPDNAYGSEDCMVFSVVSTDQVWLNDFSCSKSGRYICEVPLKPYLK